MKLTKIQRVQIALGIVPDNLPFFYQDKNRVIVKAYYVEGEWYYMDEALPPTPDELQKQFFWCCKNAPHRVGGPGE